MPRTRAVWSASRCGKPCSIPGGSSRHRVDAQRFPAALTSAKYNNELEVSLNCAEGYAGFAQRARSAAVVPVTLTTIRQLIGACSRTVTCRHRVFAPLLQGIRALEVPFHRIQCTHVDAAIAAPVCSPCMALCLMRASISASAACSRSFCSFSASTMAASLAISFSSTSSIRISAPSGTA